MHVKIRDWGSRVALYEILELIFDFSELCFIIIKMMHFKLVSHRILLLAN